ncbi:hypothetical protein N9B94_03635 [Verrucomicrobia bacterium]|nr:hypothetical protein [Verrucomicrobiota bacterium]
MKLLRRSGKVAVIELDAGEHFVVAELFKRYPVLPPSHFELSRCGEFEGMEEDEAFLQETMSDEQMANVKELKELLTTEKYIKQVGDAYQIFLERPQIEWLLQVVNDIRVGSWAMLGSPEEVSDVEDFETDPSKRSYYFAMELSTMVQSVLLMSLR